jgi:hypothetical protein
MLKKLIPLLVIVAAFAATPSAMALNDCYRCKIRSLPHTEPPQCKIVTIGPRFFDCYEDFELDDCVLTGSGCTEGTASAAPAAPLASDYAVASVERLDDAKPATNLVASLSTTR